MTGLGTQVSQQCFWTAGGLTTLLDWDWATKKYGNKVIQRNVISRLFDQTNQSMVDKIIQICLDKVV